MNAKRKVVVGAAAGLLLVGAGGAFAAGRLSSPKDERQAVINDAAKQLGIEPAKLSAALTKALQNRVEEIAQTRPSDVAAQLRGWLATDV